MRSIRFQPPVKIVVKGVFFDKSRLLNVRAGRMSAYADDPSHFVNWLWTSKEYTDKKENENLNDAFIPRHLYGQYLNETYQQVVSNLPPGFTLKIIDDKVVEIAKKKRTENGLSFVVILTDPEL